MVRNLKFLTPFLIPIKKNQLTIIILSTNRSYVISPCVTNRKKVGKREEKGIYIVNLVAWLTRAWGKIGFGL